MRIDPLIAAGVVACTALTDAVYVLFSAAVASRRRLHAANWSALWYLLSAFAVISYTQNVGLCPVRRRRLLARRLCFDDLAAARLATAGVTPACRDGAGGPRLTPPVPGGHGRRMPTLSHAIAPALPEDAAAAALAGRVWRPDRGGPSVVAVRDGALFDISAAFPTMRDLCEAADPAAALRGAAGEALGPLAAILANTPRETRDPARPWLLAPVRSAGDQGVPASPSRSRCWSA